MLPGAEENQPAGLPDVDQEPIALATDVALPKPVPISLERVISMSTGQGLVRLQPADDSAELLQILAALLLALQIPFRTGRSSRQSRAEAVPAAPELWA